MMRKARSVLYRVTTISFDNSQSPLFKDIFNYLPLRQKKLHEKETRRKRLKLREKQRLFYFSFLKLTLIALSDRSISPEYRSFLTLFELRTGSFVLGNTKLIQSWINRWQRVHCQLDHRDWISRKPVLIVEKTCLQFLDARVILRQVCTRCMRVWIARRLNRPSNAFFFLFFFRFANRNGRISMGSFNALSLRFQHFHETISD